MSSPIKLVNQAKHQIRNFEEQLKKEKEDWKKKLTGGIDNTQLFISLIILGLFYATYAAINFSLGNTRDQYSITSSCYCRKIAHGLYNASFWTLLIIWFFVHTYIFLQRELKSSQYECFRNVGGLCEAIRKWICVSCLPEHEYEDPKQQQPAPEQQQPAPEQQQPEKTYDCCNHCCCTIITKGFRLAIRKIARIILISFKYIAQGATVPILMLQVFDTYALLCFIPNLYCETASDEYKIHLAQVAITISFYFCIAAAQLTSVLLEWDERVYQEENTVKDRTQHTSLNSVDIRNGEAEQIEGTEESSAGQNGTQHHNSTNSADICEEEAERIRPDTEHRNKLNFKHYERILWYRYYKLYVAGYAKDIEPQEKSKLPTNGNNP